MTDYTTNRQERTAREHYHDATFVGVDGDGHAHYWSCYHQSVLVLDGDTVEFETVLADTPLSTLGEWMEHTRNKRGAWRVHRVDSDWGETISATLEAEA